MKRSRRLEQARHVARGFAGGGCRLGLAVVLVGMLMIAPHPAAAIDVTVHFDLIRGDEPPGFPDNTWDPGAIDYWPDFFPNVLIDGHVWGGDTDTWLNTTD